MLVRSLFGIAAMLAATSGPALAAPAKGQAAAPTLVVLPASVTLTGPKATQRLVVEARREAYAGDLTAKAKFVSSNPRVAVVDAGGRVRPVSDGVATVTALVNGKKAFATVRVRDSRKPWTWSFTNHVQPVLTKTGCNSGACHGASAGKGGLKLTLRGYDPNADHSALTRQVLGRRVVPSVPAQSLILQKPVMAVAHGGGMRFKPNSAEYGIIAQWIAAGSPSPTGKEPEIQRLEVLPAEALLRPGLEQQVVVRAHFSDGHAEDVTRWVKYGTSDEGVAAVDDEGKITVKGHGEAAITLWYLNKVAFARIVSPFATPVPKERFAKGPRANFIDDLVLRKLQALNIPPAGPASDAEFIRRAYLDAAGILPTAGETRAFLAECADGEGARGQGSGTGELVAQDRYGLAERKGAREKGAGGSAGQGRYGLGERRGPREKGAGEPGDQNGYGLAERQGSWGRGAWESYASRTAAASDSRGSGYAIRNSHYAPDARGNRVEPTTTASARARKRLIDRLLSRPEFTDYWAYKWSDLLLVSSRKLPSRGMWSFYGWIRESVAANKGWDRFAREILTASGSTLQNGAANYFVLHKDPIDVTETTTQAFLGMSLTCARCHNHPLEKWTLNDYYGMANLFARVRLKNGELAGETLVFASDSGDVNHLVTGAPVPPRPLDGTPMGLEDASDRRARLAEWMTSPRNPYFARALVNRVWRNFMGRGLVEAEDDLRLTNPPSNEALLTALSEDFVKHGFDVRHLVRTIMTSAAYQRSSVPVPGSPADAKYYSTYIPRRLPAEVLLDAISQVAGVPTAFPGYPAGTRALQLPDSQVASSFLNTFGRPQRVQTCSCERQEEPSVAQALHLSNGDTINEKLRAKGGTVEKLMAEKLTNQALLERIYLLALSRPPTMVERKRVLAAMAQFPPDGPARREAVEDLFSAMLTTKEFLFNH